MTLPRLLGVAALVAASQATPPCSESSDGSVFGVSFFGATIRYSNLGGLGPHHDSPPSIRYDDVGHLPDGRTISLLVSNESMRVPRHTRHGALRLPLDAQGLRVKPGEHHLSHSRPSTRF